MFDFISPCEQKWVYSLIALQIPKAASSSVAACLGERNLIQKHQKLFETTFGQNPLYKGVFNVRHALPSEIFRIFSAQVFEYFSFAVKRETFSRLESAFFFGKEKGLGQIYGLPPDSSFEDFINFLFESWENKREDILVLIPQSSWTHSAVFRPTEILSFENLANDWKRMILDYKIKGLPTDIPWENRSKRGVVYWTKDLKSKVEKMFKQDFELLGY